MKLPLLIPAAITVLMAMLAPSCPEDLATNPPPHARYDPAAITAFLSHTPPPAVVGLGADDNYRPATARRGRGIVAVWPSDTSLIQGLRPKAIRYPMGSGSNFHHPDGPLYGFRAAEIDRSKFDFEKDLQIQTAMDAGQLPPRRSLQDAIAQARATGAEIVYCANLMTGTPQEAVAAVTEIRAAGVPCRVVEASNELYMAEWRKFITPEQFTANYRSLLQAFEAAFGPEAPTVYVPMAGHEGRGGYFEIWNEMVRGLQPEGIILHDYTLLGWQCVGQRGTAADTAAFECLAARTAAYTYDTFTVKLEAGLQGLPPGTKLAITEWSVKNAGYGWRGSQVDAVYVHAYLQHLLRYAAGTGRLTAATIQSGVSEHPGAQGLIRWNAETAAFETAPAYDAFRNVSLAIPEGPYRVARARLPLPGIHTTILRADGTDVLLWANPTADTAYVQLPAGSKTSGAATPDPFTSRGPALARVPSNGAFGEPTAELPLGIVALLPNSYGSAKIPRP